MLPADWPAVREIYLEGIATRQATFETDAPSWEAWDASHSPFARLVARQDEMVAGWAALSPVSSRKVYAGVAEVSVYVAESQRGLGFGRHLLAALIAESETNRVWTLQAVTVFPRMRPASPCTAAAVFVKSGGANGLLSSTACGAIQCCSRDAARRLELTKNMAKNNYNIEDLFKALADRTRLRLISLIGDSEVCVCFFVAILKTSQPKISRHLAYLRRAGIVKARREGKWMHYRLAEPPDEHAARIFREVRASLTEHPEF